jgi:hypothetical protein
MGLDTAGEWYEQEISGTRMLVSEQADEVISFRFYGTDVEIIARVGPEAGRVYVEIDGRPVSGLLQDERGSYVTLRTTQAANRSITVASGLAHEEHEIALSNGGAGEFALSDFVITARTPFQWAFITLYGALALAIFATLRALALDLVRQRGWLALIESSPSRVRTR